MRHISIEPPAFFHRGPSPLARLAFFGLISIALLFVDTRYHYLEGIRRVVAVGAAIRCSARRSMPEQALSDIGGYFASLRALIEENDGAASASSSSRSAAAQGFAVAQQENARLRALIDRLVAATRRRATAVEVLYTSRDPVRAEALRRQGRRRRAASRAKRSSTQTAWSVKSRASFPSMAEVTLVTDKDHAVPVKVQRSGVRSVLYGSGAGRAPELRFMAPSADIQVGDTARDVRVSTAPIRRVSRSPASRRSIAETGQMFARITCTPLAGVDRSEHLLVLAKSTVTPPRPDEPAEADAVKKPGKGRRKGARYAVMALPNIGQLASAGPDEILRPVRPWFIVATVALALRRQHAAAVRRRARAQARLRRADASLLVHPGAALCRRRHRLVDRAADGCRRRDAVRPARARVRVPRLRRRVLPPPRAALPARGSRRCRSPCCCGLCAALVLLDALRRRRAAAAMDVRGAAARRRAAVAGSHARDPVVAAPATIEDRVVTAPFLLR